MFENDCLKAVVNIFSISTFLQFFYKPVHGLLDDDQFHVCLTPVKLHLGEPAPPKVADYVVLLDGQQPHRYVLVRLLVK